MLRRQAGAVPDLHLLARGGHHQPELTVSREVRGADAGAEGVRAGHRVLPRLQPRGRVLLPDLPGRSRLSNLLSSLLSRLLLVRRALSLLLHRPLLLRNLTLPLLVGGVVAVVGALILRGVGRGIHAGVLIIRLPLLGLAAISGVCVDHRPVPRISV